MFFFVFLLTMCNLFNNVERCGLLPERESVFCMRSPDEIVFDASAKKVW